MSEDYVRMVLTTVIIGPVVHRHLMGSPKRLYLRKCGGLNIFRILIFMGNSLLEKQGPKREYETSKYTPEITHF